MSADALKSAIRRLAFGESLSAEDSAAAFDAVMRGDATPSQVGALLMALRVKGESPDEVAGAARALRAAMVRLPSDAPDALVDTCGTGGGALQTFNISTAAALLAAGAGARVAKHGNRSFTSRSGSADVLEALGVPIEASVEVMERALAEAGIVFMFAPLMHPAMKHVGPVRRELGVPTVMNIIGPLANPASAGRQVLGVAEEARLELLASALLSLGTTHALVVHGAPGMDEISPIGRTRVLEIRDGRIDEHIFDPADLGFGDATAAHLAGGDPAENARVILSVLENRGAPGARAAVLLNAGAALYVAGLAATFRAGLDRAATALEEGKGIEALERLRKVYGKADR